MTEADVGLLLLESLELEVLEVKRFVETLIGLKEEKEKRKLKIFRFSLSDSEADFLEISEAD